MAAYPLLANLATVLYTFYPPLLADWTFYVGLDARRGRLVGHGLQPLLHPLGVAQGESGRDDALYGACLPA